jgi:galactokinase
VADADDVARRLTTPAEVRDSFRRRFGGAATLYAAPGRINLIGEHTDYNDGFVLPATVDLHTWVAAGPREDSRLLVQMWRDSEPLEIDPQRLEPTGDGRPAEYVKGVAWALQQAGVPLAGGNLVVGGNIPLGGGLSSSASLELALAWALLERSGARLGRAEAAALCRRAEAEFVGMPCGLMDQYAVALGQAGKALHLDCRSLACEAVPMPASARFLLVHSGVRHRLAAGEYRRRREECEAAVAALRADIPGLRSLRDLGAAELEAARGRLDATLYRRCRHVVGENRRVGEACEALRGGDLLGLGNLLNASHASLRDDFEVSCAEVDRLVEVANAQPGVRGSRMMGGGFGGCTITLVDAGAVDEAVAGIVEAYGRVLGRRPWTHLAGPADPVGPWEEADEPG